MQQGATCLVDGFGPLPCARPASVAELSEHVREAASANAALYPVGGQTQLSLGGAPTRPGSAVDLRDLTRVIDFPARDMTVTVEAGITIASLNDLLAREKLRLPIDVAQADRATLGGILATNTSGARRFGYGTLRDYVIGIAAVNDEGSEFKAGGRVVKNVAGYDLCKLLVGSLGTLGIITQATLKLRPLAEQQALLCVGLQETCLDEALSRLHATRTRPVCIELLNRDAATVVLPQGRVAVPETPWVLLVGYEGNADAVGWQVHQLVKDAGVQCHLEARLDFTAQPLCHALTEFALWPEAEFALKANVVPSAVPSFCQAVNGEPNRPTLKAHAGNGIVCGQWRAGLTSDQAARMLTQWRTHAAKGQGCVVVTRCPPAWKATLDVWGKPRGDAWLCREVKKAFDPRGIFNPGRFVDGI